jgi:hypothetical protein
MYTWSSVLCLLFPRSTLRDIRELLHEAIGEGQLIGGYFCINCADE